ncbi:MAG: hypothetical protein PHY14_04235 [Candidatus Gracilibacteria bacterium]|nr:hypothetical protein [Candidatus Gracilibacteria bacterium]
MKKSIFLICGIAGILPLSIGAAGGGPSCDKREYSCYQEWVNTCNNSSKPWKANKGVGSVEVKNYAELSANAQNKKITEIINKEKYPTERAKLEAQLSLDRIGAFAGFKAVEIARNQYRSNMNKIFSCAVIASRIEKTQKVLEAVKKVGESEISRKLEADIKKLGAMKPTGCAANMGTETLNDYGLALASSATTEYCSYRNYLDYLQENINSNYTDVLNLEQKIGNNGESQSNPSTIESAASDMNLRARQITDDIARANSTLPKALVAYREMERTYPLHIMFLIIYDDYLDLRQNTTTYLNAVSQLFEKANNAQSANNN